MATTMEDEMGWTRRDNYCSSSSEDEEERVEEPRAASPPRKLSSGLSCNTGPKGVLEDWRQFKKLGEERKAQREDELVAIAKRVSLTCRSHREDELAEKEEEERKERMESEEDDNFLNEYAAKRMREMLQMYQSKQSPQFGVVYELLDADAFVRAIDEDSKSATLLLHLYESKVKSCEVFDRCLSALAQQYTMVKFCRVRASLVGASKRLQLGGLPAVLAYRDGQLIGNFVRIGEELDDDFDVDNVKQYLKEFGVLPDLSNLHKTESSVKGRNQKEYSDSDSE